MKKCRFIIILFSAALIAAHLPAQAGITDGLVGYWKFDEGGGGVAYDSSGAGRDGVIQGNPQWSTGKTGQAVSLDGIDDGIVLNNSIDLPNQFTFSVWVKRGGSTGVQPLLSSQIGRPILAFHGSSNYRVYIGQGSGDFWSYFNIPAGEWVHIAASYDGAKLILYMNGQGPQISQPAAAALVQVKYIGQAGGAYGKLKLKGELDETRVYNRCLAPDEVRQLYYGSALFKADNLNLTQQNFSVELLNPNVGFDTVKGMSIMLQKRNGAFIDAGDLQGIDPGNLVDDRTVYRTSYLGATYPVESLEEKAVRLAAGGVRIPLRFNNLRQGVYAVRLIGRGVNPAGRIVKPVYVHLKINDGPAGEVHDYRMKVLYTDATLEDVGRMFFLALNKVNNLSAELYIGPGSQEELLVHRLEFYDALGGTSAVRIKQGVGTFTDAERTLLRQWAQEIASKEGAALDENGIRYDEYDVWKWIHYKNDPLRPQYVPSGLSEAQRMQRDDALWDALLPINSMHGLHAFYAGDPRDAGFDALPNGVTRQDFENQYGVWDIEPAGVYPYDKDDRYDVPFKLVNKKLGLVYTLDDYLNRRSLPDPYPLKDDGMGVYFQDAAYPGGMNAFIIAPLASYKIQPVNSNALIKTSDGYGAGLATRYHQTGDLDVARDAAIILVKWALQWPTMQMEAQDVGLNSASKDFLYNVFNRWNKLGKYVYSGWSGPEANSFARAYDYLYDYIQGNQGFANALHRFIPWIEGPDDIIALLDSHLIQATVHDAEVGRVRQYDPILHGLVLGPSAAADALLDISKVTRDIYPLSNIPIKVHYGNSLNRDGTHYIGSTFYALGVSEDFVGMAAGMKRYQQAGGNVPYDLSDLAHFPKVRAAAGMLFDKWIAGGYDYGVGDVGGPYTPRFRIPYTADFVRRIWVVTRDYRAAWLIANVFGRAGESEQEWSEITQAATGRRDPRISMQSRVLGGFGVAILELGVSQDDYRRKTALAIRTGTGTGHAHNDALDLSFFSLGLQMANDFGQRNEGERFTIPPDHASYTHNTVEVDGRMHPYKISSGWPGGSFSRAEGWVEEFTPQPGSQYVSAGARSTDHPNVQLFRRDSALIDMGDTQSSSQAYVFDVFRVKGGKWHTWCFHGADTSGEADGFRVTPALTRIDDADTASLSAQYLRKHANGTRFEGVAPDKIEAFWRVGRSRLSFPNMCAQDGTCLNNVTTVAAEQNMYGGDFNAASPRKYTKVTLFNRQGDTVMAGNLFSAYYAMNIPNLFVQRRQPEGDYAAMAEIEDVYPAIIEAYAGSSSLTSRALSVSPNEQDAYQAVALEVRSSSGQQDILVSDGRAGARSVDQGNLAVQGEFAHYQRRDGNFKMAHLVGGSQIQGAEAGVYPAQQRYITTISWVDYRAMRLGVNAALPLKALSGSEFFIHNVDHRTSYRLTAAGSELCFDRDPLIMDMLVVSVTGSDVATDRDYMLQDFANRKKGYTGTNELRNKFWKIDLTGYMSYTLTGDTVEANDFTDEDRDGRVSLLVYDFGPGDTVELPTDVILIKKDAQMYELRTNTACSIRLAGAGNMELQNAQGAWVDITSAQDSGSVEGSVAEVMLTGGSLLLRLNSAALPNDLSGNGSVTAYDAALALQQGRGALEAAQIAERAVGLIN
ncbi:MAG: hypothetical protein A3G38_00020 [Omnitrophica WOR_2 bacterium RIFCSPLOWO2_12_FULL_51_8]|nr:MAG: hypothetical protein A3G38_00020 [Omnitrophica WOR_2 bacterium RIFCSPLOWO2_12_FULL_51_8]